MPRNISFALTTPQFLARTKTVTRRCGWRKLKAGDLLQAIEKGMGLKKGERVVKLGMIRVVSARREPLRRMIDESNYGILECEKEGFPFPHEYSTPIPFVEMFCASHSGCTLETEITRIEYEYID